MSIRMERELRQWLQAADQSTFCRRAPQSADQAHKIEFNRCGIRHLRWNNAFDTAVA